MRGTISYSGKDLDIEIRNILNRKNIDHRTKMKKFFEILKSEKGITQTQIAEAEDITQQAISNLKNPKLKNPDLLRIIKIIYYISKYVDLRYPTKIAFIRLFYPDDAEIIEAVFNPFNNHRDNG